MAENKTSNLAVLIDKIEETAQKRQSAKVIQLPLWDDRMRGLPNSIARSALFNVRNKTASRRAYKQEEVACVGGIMIRYTGEELRQDDEDVFLQLIHLARVQPLGDEIKFSGYEFLKELRWNTNSRSYERLADCMIRLKATALTVMTTVNDAVYAGSLVRDFIIDKASKSTQQWAIRLEPRILALFSPDSYSQLEWNLRMELQSPLEKWLYSFYLTHQNPYGYKVATLKKLCGSTSKTLFHYRADLRAALERLRKRRFFSAYNIDGNDVVSVQRTPASNLPRLPLKTYAAAAAGRR